MKKVQRSSYLILIALLLVYCQVFLMSLPVSYGANQNTFCNPLNIDYRFSIAAPTYREAADPCIVVYNNEYYLFASHSGGYWWSTNFMDWNFVTPTGIDIEKWAPSVIIIGSTMYYTSSQEGDIYKTTNPKGGTWTRVSHPHDWGDPALFLDDDGKVYCYHNCSANGSIDVVQLDPNNNFNAIGSEVQCFFANKAQHGFEVPGDNNTSYNGDVWIEGAWMTKYNGSYYLQYSVPGTELRSYCDGVYKSSSPMGPFVFCANSPVTARELGFVTGTGHGCTFKDLNGKYWRADTVTVSVNQMFERRLAVFPASFDSDGLMFSNTAFGDYPQYLPSQSVNSVTNNLAGWYLLSNGKVASASSTNGSFSASNAVDENIRSWWCASTGNSGEWLSVDLGKNCTVNALQVNFAEQDGTYASGRSTAFSYKYKVEYSTNGTSWTMLVDKSGNTKDFPHDYTELTAAVTARYIKVTNLGTVPGYGKFAVSDLRIFGNGGSSLPGSVTSVNAIRNTDQRSATISWSGVSGAQGYVIRYGTAANKLYNNYQMNSTSTSYTINSLNIGQSYYFTVDSFNDSGITQGTVVVSAAPSAPLDRTGWTASASLNTGAAGNALDGNASTRWDTGAYQTNGQWFTVDMKTSKTLNKISLDTTGSPNDYPRGYQVYVSNDGTNFGAVIASGAGSSAITDITFTAQTARYVKIVQTGSSSSFYWSIHEINLYNSGANPTPTPVPTVTITSTAIVPTPTATGTVLFTTGLESGNIQPTWIDTIEVSSNVSGYFSGINPECGVRTGESSHAGTASLMFSGTDNNATTSFCYFKVFDVNIPITATTKLSYWFYSQMELARGVAVDFVCTDGTTLRDSGARDQNGISMHPGNSRGTINSWNQVQCNVGQWLNGKTIDRILVGYDLGPSTGQFRGFIDDIQVNN